MTRKERQQFEWTFRGFQTPLGGRPVSDWIKGLSQEAVDDLVDIVLYMRVRPQYEWDGEHFQPVEDGISEVRFYDAAFTHRVYGYFGPAWLKQNYTFLVGSSKKVKNDKASKLLARSRRDQI